MIFLNFRLFDILGPIFKFVSKDLNTKLDILTDYHCKGK